MNLKKIIYFFILPLLAIIIAISVVVGINIMNSKKTPISFSEYIKQGEYGGLRLTIYYMRPTTSTPAPVSIDELLYGNNPPKKKNEIYGWYDYKIILEGGSNDHENFEILKQLADLDIIPVENVSYTNARIYYVFENEKGQKIYDVAMWGYLTNSNNSAYVNSVYVNGIAVEWNDTFCEVIMPFLPGKDARILERYVTEHPGFKR